MKTPQASQDCVSRCEPALSAFERVLRIGVSFNDFGGGLAMYLTPERRCHKNAYCFHAKKKFLRLCMGCDVESVLKHAKDVRRGFFKLCPPGVLEIVMPLWNGNTLPSILYIGPFRLDCSKELPHDTLVVHPQRRLPRQLREQQEQLPQIRHSDMSDLFQMAIMLADQIESIIVSPAISASSYRDRAWRIKEFLSRNFARKEIGLGCLADSLHLSESRAGHLVKSLLGMTFPEALACERLRHARRLLAHTLLSANEIATHAGFSDPGYFHRLFKRYEKMTPLEFRKEAQKNSPIQP